MLAAGHDRSRRRIHERSWGPNTAGRSRKKANSPYSACFSRLTVGVTKYRMFVSVTTWATIQNITPAQAQLAQGMIRLRSQRGSESRSTNQTLRTASSMPRANRSR